MPIVVIITNTMLAKFDEEKAGNCLEDPSSIKQNRYEKLLTMPA